MSTQNRDKSKYKTRKYSKNRSKRVITINKNSLNTFGKYIFANMLNKI